jgi:hypothetical protein
MANIIYKRKCTSTRDAREIIHSETNKAKGKLQWQSSQPKGDPHSQETQKTTSKS